MSVLKKLTEGIVNRDLGKEGSALLSKWERTGLLEGLDNDNSRSTMALALALVHRVTTRSSEAVSLVSRLPVV